jgi:amidase
MAATGALVGAIAWLQLTGGQISTGRPTGSSAGRLERHVMHVTLRIGASAALLGTVLLAQRPARSQARPFSVVEATIAEMRAAMAQRRVTSREIVLESLARIAAYDGQLHATITVSRHAVADGEARDQERLAGRVRGPLHGIPVALKDNIQTTAMPTTGGALAFADLVPPYAATVTRLLEEAGAVVIAKTGMTELANWVAGSPTPMPGNYNALRGFGLNPYDPRRDLRPGSDGRPLLSTGGSSSGIGTAASFWAANVGTETSGSILSPASQTMLAAVKPTVGRISRYGIIPITADQDTAGPMARTVADAALLLGVLEGPAPDPHDPATKACTPPPRRDYTAFLTPGALRGARIGVPRRFFFEHVLGPEGMRKNSPDARVMSEALDVLRQQGAVVIDPADVPSVAAAEPDQSFLRWDICAGAGEGRGRDAHCSTVLKYGMKRDFNSWLTSLGAAAPVRSLTALREWNLAHRAAGALKYGQSLLDISDEVDLEADRPRYLADRAKDLRLTTTEGLDRVIGGERLDAVVFVGADGASLGARAGYPTVIVPFGLISSGPKPGAAASAEVRSRPLGISFTGLACSEPRLLALAHAFEQATRRRVAPQAFPALPRAR